MLVGNDHGGNVPSCFHNRHIVPRSPGKQVTGFREKLGRGWRDLQKLLVKGSRTSEKDNALQSIMAALGICIDNLQTWRHVQQMQRHNSI